MADSNETQNMPVSLPPRGFEMDVLQKALEAAAGKVKPDDAADVVRDAMQAAVAAVLSDDQPALDTDPAAMSGYQVVQVQDLDTGYIREQRVFVPDDLTPSKLAVIESASVGTDMVLNDKGKAVSASDTAVIADIIAKPSSASASKEG